MAAFGLVRAAAAADALQQAAISAAATGSSVSSSISDATADAVTAAGGVDVISVVLSTELLGPAALYAGQSMLLFGFAAVALEVRC